MRHKPLDVLRAVRQSTRRVFASQRLRLARKVFDPATLSAIDTWIHNGSMNPEDLPWITRIEELRDILNASSEPLVKLDFGAGSSDAPRSREEAQQGIEVHTTIGDVARETSKPQHWCSLLFRLIRTFKPVVVLEMGTSVGISAAYQATALQLNGKGRLVTLEGSETVAQIARRTFEILELDNTDIVVGRFSETLEEALKTVGPVDFVFVDGHHDGNATIDYCEQILPYLTEKAILILDDIRWSPNMTKAWRVVKDRDCVRAALDLGSIGVCLIGPGDKRTVNVRLR